MYYSRYVVLVILIWVAASGCSAPPPGELGLHSGRLAPCPKTPNCVSSMDSSGASAIEPFRLARPEAPVMEILADIIGAEERATLHSTSSSYLHAVYRTRIFGFEDDLEFYLPEDRDVLHVRSAARRGYWDGGVNARRVERIRSIFLSRQQ